MANTNSYSSEAIRVKLTGYDIPGVTLHAPFEGHAVSTLKMQLLCRGSMLLVRGRSHSLSLDIKTVFFFLTVSFI